MPEFGGLVHFVRARREVVAPGEEYLRMVYRTTLVRNAERLAIVDYIADRTPFFYRPLEAILSDFRSGLFMTAIKSTLSRLPTVVSFQESHFGEVVAGVFCHDVLNLRIIYSKLSMLTAENTNAHKMDLVMYDPASNPVRIVFGEVKSSPKERRGGVPAGHDASCYADLFNSFNAYDTADEQFDLTAARDHIDRLRGADQDAVRAALLPYSSSTTAYAGFVVIDDGTYSVEETRVLRSRRNDKSFEVDLICLESFSSVAQEVYGKLQSAISAKDGAH